MKTLAQQIENYGFAVRMIPAEADYPAFAYTIGLWERYQHPEIIILGLPIETMHQILNNVGEAVQNGTQFLVGNHYQDIVNQYPVTFVAVEKRYFSEYFGQAIHYYDTENFTALQLLWTDKNGKFPFEKDFDEKLKKLQSLG